VSFSCAYLLRWSVVEPSVMLSGDVLDCSVCIIGWNHSCTFLRSVVCHLSRSYTLLKPFDGLRCHLAGTFAGSKDTLC